MNARSTTSGEVSRTQAGGEDLPWLSRAARARPDHPALITPHRTWSYRELEERVAFRAGQLLNAGLQPGDHLGIWMSNEPAFVELVHAATLLGCPLVILNARLTPSELAPLLDRARPRLLIHADALCSAAHAATQNGSGGTRPLAVSELDQESAAALPRSQTRIHGLDHAILFTSGTTGTPKGVRLSLAQHEASARATAARLGVSSQDRWLLCMPVYHIGGLAILLRAALFATSVMLHERFDVDTVTHALLHQSVSHVSLVPTMLARLLERAPQLQPPETLRCVLLGGGPIAHELVARALSLGWPLCGTYGMTEAASGIATTHPGDSDLTWLPPLPHTELSIVDSEGRPVPAGVAGEICVRGPQIMSGYLGSPALTLERLREGWLHTGDMGELDARGRLRILDRRTDLIVSGGENIYPAEVENVLLKHPRVSEVALIGLPDPHWGQRAVAVVVERGTDTPISSLLESELLELCARELAGYKRPRTIMRWSEPLPRTASGKLQRDVLRRQVSA